MAFRIYLLACSIGVITIGNLGAPVYGQTTSKPKLQKKHQPLKSNSERDLALGAVSTAVQVASQLDPESRGFLLASACGAVAHSSPAKAITYCDSAFDAAQEMALLDPFSLRVGVQDGVVAKLVSLDPDKAADMLIRVDRPEWTAYPTDDFRTHSAALLIDRLLTRNAKEDLEQATDLLDYLGETGQYPYRAAGQVMQFFHDRGKDWRSVDVFSRALAFFQKDDQFGTSPERFADLVLSTPKEVPSSSLIIAIRAIVDKTRAAEDLATKQGNSDGQKFIVTSPSGNLPLGRKSSYLALRLLPLAKRLDPGLAAELERLDPDLKSILKGHSTQELNNWSAGSLAVLHGDPTPGQVQQFDQLISDRRTLTTIQGMSDKDVGKSIGLSKSIHDESLRTQALAAIAKSLVKSDQPRAAGLLNEAEASLEAVDDDQQKVEAIAKIASIWAEIGDTKKFSSLLSKGYSLAEALWKKERDSGADEEALLLGPAAGLFRLLAQVEATTNGAGVNLRAQSMQLSPSLRALILIEAAKVMLAKYGQT